jgi:hypothetical protein
MLLRIPTVIPADRVCNTRCVMPLTFYTLLLSILADIVYTAIRDSASIQPASSVFRKSHILWPYW